MSFLKKINYGNGNQPVEYVPNKKNIDAIIAGTFLFTLALSGTNQFVVKPVIQKKANIVHEANTISGARLSGLKNSSKSSNYDGFKITVIGEKLFSYNNVSKVLIDSPYEKLTGVSDMSKLHLSRATTTTNKIEYVGEMKIKARNNDIEINERRHIGEVPYVTVSVKASFIGDMPIKKRIGG